MANKKTIDGAAPRVDAQFNSGDFGRWHAPANEESSRKRNPGSVGMASGAPFAPGTAAHATSASAMPFAHSVCDSWQMSDFDTFGSGSFGNSFHDGQPPHFADPLAPQGTPGTSGYGFGVMSPGSLQFPCSPIAAPQPPPPAPPLTAAPVTLPVPVLAPRGTSGSARSKSKSTPAAQATGGHDTSLQSGVPRVRQPSIAAQSPVSDGGVRSAQETIQRVEKAVSSIPGKGTDTKLFPNKLYHAIKLCVADEAARAAAAGNPSTPPLAVWETYYLNDDASDPMNVRYRIVIRDLTEFYERGYLAACCAIANNRDEKSLRDAMHKAGQTWGIKITLDRNTRTVTLAHPAAGALTPDGADIFVMRKTRDIATTDGISARALTKMDEISGQVSHLAGRVADLEDRVGQDGGGAAQANQGIAPAQPQHAAADSAQIAQLQGTIAAMQESAGASRAKIADLERTVAELQQARSADRARIAELTKSVSTLVGDMREFLELRRLQAKFGVAAQAGSAVPMPVAMQGNFGVSSVPAALTPFGNEQMGSWQHAAGPSFSYSSAQLSGSTRSMAPRVAGQPHGVQPSFVDLNGLPFELDMDPSAFDPSALFGSSADG